MFTCCLRHGIGNTPIMPKGPQKIEIEKNHLDLLLSLTQAVATKYSNFLGTALMVFHSNFNSSLKRFPGNPC